MIKHLSVVLTIAFIIISVLIIVVIK